jgi:hypothetical protein
LIADAATKKEEMLPIFHKDFRHSSHGSWCSLSLKSALLIMLMLGAFPIMHSEWRSRHQVGFFAINSLKQTNSLVADQLALEKQTN